MIARMLELIAAIIGLVTTWLYIKQSHWGWPVGFVMVLLYTVIFYQAKLYADMGLQVIYIGLQCYGWYQWRFASGAGRELPVTRIPRSYFLPLALLWITASATLGWVLWRYTDAHLVMIDSANAIFCLVAQWCLARKYIENWLLWLISDAVYAAMYLTQSLYLTALLYLVLVGVAIYGYYSWLPSLNVENARLKPLRDLCVALGLGKLLAPAKSVTGGYSHQNWYISTEQGEFLLKRLARGLMAQTGYRERLLAGVQFGQQLQQQGLPVQTAITFNDQLIQTWESEEYLLRPWQRGHTIPAGTATQVQAEQIGGLLAKIHCYGQANALPQQWHVVSQSDWQTVLLQAEQQQASWLPEISANWQRVQNWQAQYETAIQQSQQAWLLSHCDLQQLNVIWTDDKPTLIDWELAGPIDPAVELLGVALNWAGITVAKPNLAIYQAVLSAYYANDGLPVAIDDGVYARGLGSWLQWLHLNMVRSLEPENYEAQQVLAQREVVRTLNTLMRIEEFQNIVASGGFHYVQSA